MSTAFLRHFGLPGRSTGLLAGALLAALAAAPAQAQTFYGLNRGGNLLFTNTVTAASGGAVPTGQVISGLTAGQTLVGLDSRPATGQLIALAYDPATGQGQLYNLNKTTAVATAIGVPVALPLGTSTEGIGFDFNPTVDRVRATSSNGNQVRLNPVNGALAGTDTPLNFGAGAGTGTPAVGSIAYTNSFIATTSTILYDIDESRNTLFVQNPANPNSGTLLTPVTLTIGGSPLLVAGDQTDFDIYTDPATRVQSTLLARTRGGLTNLYSLNLTTGEAQRLAVNAGAGSSIDDLAFDINRTAPTPAADARLLYAVTAASNLVSFNSDRPDFLLAAVPVTGLAAGQVLAATDFRPNTDELFGLGYDPTLTTANARLYVINPTTAVATPVGTAPISLNLGTSIDGIAADFNPIVDRLRVTSIDGANLRLNPTTGTVAGTDPNLNFVDGTTGTPSIGAVAYTNSYVGSTGTRLYDIDGVRNRLYVQGLTTNPNLGQLTAVNNNPLFANTFNSSFDLDIAFDAPTQVNRAFAVANAGATAPDGFSTLYTVDLTTAQTTAVGVVGLGVPVREVAAFLTGASTAAPLTGRLLYAVAAGNLVSFDSNNPGVIRSAVNILNLPATQVLAGLDFRPLTGDLYALGYDATNQLGQLYILNLSTGALSAVGGLNALPMGTTANALGIDFNPNADAIRVVSATNQANAAINPNTGAVTVNTPVSNPNGVPAMSALAYSNNDNNAATPTVLYGYDQVRNQLMSTTNGVTAAYTDLPNVAGVTLGATGVEFDIFSDVTDPAAPTNQGLLVGNRIGTTTDNFYNVNLTTGSVLLIGRIGSGSNLTGMAAFLTPVFLGITWTGALSTDWGTAGNWSTGAVPGPTDNVTIPNVANKPVVSNAQQANNVVLLPGTTLTTAPGGVLTVNGNLANNGATLLSSGTGTVAFAGAAAQSVSGTTAFFSNLTAGPAGLTAIAPVQVQRVLQLNGNLFSNGNLTLLSNATGTAQVTNAGGVVAGNATVQRFIDPTSNPGLGYRHYSAPVSGSTVNDLATAGFTPVVNPAYNTVGNTATPFPTVFSYDQSRVTTGTNPAPQDFDRGFLSPNALTDALEVGRGYAVNIPAAQTVDFVGLLNNGAYTRGSLGRGLALAQDPSNASGWHLLGNPYPSPIDWDLVSLSNVDAAVYVFRSTGQYAGTYRAYVAGSGLSDGSDQLAVGQGFFVRVSTPGSSTGQVSFSNAARLSTAASPVFQRNAGTAPLVRLALANATGQADETMVYFEAGATAGFDAQYDAYKLRGGSALLLATEISPATLLAINAQPALTATAGSTVPLRIEGQPGTYTLRAADLLRLPAGLFAYLRDAQTGAVVDLAQQPDYAFALSGPATGRFSLQITATRVLANAPAALAQQVALYPNPASGRVSVLLPADLAREATPVQLLNALGQTVLRATLPAGSAGVRTLALPSVAAGVYTLRLQTAQGSISKRLVLE